MNDLSAQAILFAYYSILSVLALFGGHRLFLLALYYRTRHRRSDRPPNPDVWPRVTVQLPLFNELYVAERLIRSVCNLDYPADRLEIQVLDDSTDETRLHVARLVAEYQQQGVRIRHLHRTDRTGFKAGALANGLECADGELIAVFDADFVPQREYLRLSVPHFQDLKIGMVQACWDHLNRDYSLLTRIQAMLLDGHFLIEHAARQRSGRFFNFNGTAGIWRKQAILDAGGWQHDTLTEDLDLSYRAQLAGWRFLYLQDLRVPSELPVEINAFKRQQFRWAKGSIQTGRKLLRRILAAPIPWWVKIESLFHLTNNASYVGMVALSLLVFPAMLLRRGSSARMILLVDLPLFLCATVSVLAFYIASQLVRTGSLTGRLRHLLPLMGLGIGLAVNNSRAVLEGLRKDVGVFERTPKYNIESRKDGWQQKKYRAKGNLSLLLEGLLASYFAAVFVLAWQLGMWMSLPFLYLFLQGYSYMFLLSTISLRSQRPRRQPLEEAPGTDQPL
jgi:cellulose synthase/poly-beta-1,6-N-acetylglucosamine synthase-like glycosyltransferase